MHLVSHSISQEILYYETQREIFTSSNLLHFTSVLNKKIREGNFTWIGCEHSFGFVFKIIKSLLRARSTSREEVATKILRWCSGFVGTEP